MSISVHAYGRTERPNAIRVQLPTLSVWFSYQSPVAFSGPATDYEAVVRCNDWGPTTGRHLNWIDNGDKANRLPGPEFERRLADALHNEGY